MNSREFLESAGFTISEPYRYGQAVKHPPATQVIKIARNDFILKNIRADILDEPAENIMKYIFSELAESYRMRNFLEKQWHEKSKELARVQDIIEGIFPQNNTIDD